MDGNLGPEELRTVMAMCGRAIEEVTLPETNPGRIELLRRVEDVISALATVRTRLEVALVLGRVPRATSGVGTSAMASEAVDRLLVAINNVVAFRDA